MQMKGGREWTCPSLNVHRPLFPGSHLWQIDFNTGTCAFTLMWQIKDFSRHSFNQANLHTRKKITWTVCAALFILEWLVSFFYVPEHSLQNTPPTERQNISDGLRNSPWADVKWKLYQEQRHRYWALETRKNYSQVFPGKLSGIFD